MRWGRQTDEERELRALERRRHFEHWHKAFAILPRKTKTGWIWLEWGQRKLTWQPGIGWEGDGAGYYAQWKELEK